MGCCRNACVCASACVCAFLYHTRDPCSTFHYRCGYTHGLCALCLCATTKTTTTNNTPKLYVNVCMLEKPHPPHTPDTRVHKKHTYASLPSSLLSARSCVCVCVFFVLVACLQERASAPPAPPANTPLSNRSRQLRAHTNTAHDTNNDATTTTTTRRTRKNFIQKTHSFYVYIYTIYK